MNSAENSSVAAVIPTFNSEKVVVRALDSVVQQSVRPREIIVVDDASTDGTVEVVRKFAEQHTEVEPIVNERNLGPGPTRNKGWSLAKSDFVAFLDADDSWHPQKIERQLKFFAEHPGEVACGTTHLIADRNCAPTTIKGDAEQISRFSLTDLLRRNRFTTPSAMLRRDIIQRFDSNLRLAEDYLLWM
ncbi:MAG: glycosyltransferase family 2 protein, partial [Actinomycetota bacterium]